MSIPTEVAETVINRAAGYCEVMFAAACTGRAEHLHHRKLRSQLGRHEVENLLHICHQCHNWIDAHPAASYERGFLVRGVREPAHHPVLYRNGKLLYLTRSGEVVKGGRQ